MNAKRTSITAPSTNEISNVIITRTIKNAEMIGQDEDDLSILLKLRENRIKISNLMQELSDEKADCIELIPEDEKYFLANVNSIDRILNNLRNELKAL